MKDLLTEEKIVSLFREEWAKKLQAIAEVNDIDLKVFEDEKTLISPDLKVFHKKSNLKYTVVSVSPREVVLKTADGKEFSVTVPEFEKEYGLE
jgi:nitrogenase molybdenum-iron protein alpha/beta subunit